MAPVRTLRFGLLFLILVNAAYLRGADVGLGVTSSYFIICWILASVLLVGLTMVKTKSTVIATRWYPWYGLFLWTVLSLGFNLVTRPHAGLALQFAAELSLNFLVFLAFLYLLDRDLLESIYRAFLVASSVAGLVLLLYPWYSGAVYVRRVGGYELPGGVNNISTMLAVAIVIAAVGVVKAETWRERRVELISIPTLVAGLLLSGSRAAMLGLLVAMGLLVFVSDLDMARFIAGAGGIAVSGFALLTMLYDLTGLYRFGYRGLLDAFNTRLFLYSTAIEQGLTDGISVLFGGGMYRYSKIAEVDLQPPIDTIIYPHNYVISLLVHVGLPAAVLFTIALLWNYRSLLYMTVASDSSPDYLTLCTLLSLIIISMYSFTSGRVTRTFPLWIFLAISEFLFISNVKNLDPRARLDWMPDPPEADRASASSVQRRSDT